MHVLISITAFILVVLIKIGDAIIWIFKLSYATIKNIFTWIIDYFRDVRNELISAGRFGLKILKSIKSFFRRLKPKRHKNIKSLKQQRKTTLLTKIKYFLLGSIFSGIFIFTPAVSLLLFESLPNPQALSALQLPQTTKIYDRNHKLLYEIYANQNRTIVPLSALPSYLKQATISIEDKNFYKNPGFDVSAIIRAASSDLSGGEFQGGSTITQQLIKVSLLSPKISIIRKIEEIVLALWTEKIYSKNQILEMYFNQVPYGGTAWGVEAASEVYFDKNVKDLDLAQCAFLAGIPRAPSLYSPYGNYPNLWKKRQEEVLSKMQQLGYITKEQQLQANQEQIAFEKPQIPLLAPHFVMYVKDWLVNKYGLSTVEKGGLEVITSLDLATQNMAQKIVTDEVAKDAYLTISNGAALIVNPKNGDILAMVGSKDFNDPNGGNVNLTTSLRQPGSSIKLVTYSAGLEHGFTAATRIDDTPMTFKDLWGNSYSPVNYDGKFHGSVTVRTALANSFNIPAVKILNTIGLPTFLDLAKQMGISSLKDASNYGLSITLGGGDVTMIDMTTAYATLANQGERVDLNPILKITDSRSDILEEKKETAKTKVLDPGIAYIISDILADNNARSLEFGSNSPLNIPNHTVSVKTGTSDDKRDNWTFGYTPSLVVAAWVGNNDNSPMNPALASGITGAAPIWHDIVTNILSDKPDEKQSKPMDVVDKNCFGRTEYFLAGTENSVNCNIPLTPSPTQSAFLDQLRQHLVSIKRIIRTK